MGAYVGSTNRFNTGSLVERTRGIRLTGNSLAPVHRLWKELLGVIRSGELDSAVTLTHCACIWLGNTANVHRRFGKKGGSEGIVKIPSRPGFVRAESSRCSRADEIVRKGGPYHAVIFYFLHGPAV